ncbi:MAG: TldD/PmbA family protein [archaeon]|nr:TldD/PmbA family protein [archaeon]
MIPIEKAAEVKDELFNEIQRFSSKEKPKLADFRLEVSNGLGAEALNGNIKGAAKDYSAEIGVRVFAGKVVAGGFAGKNLGQKDFENIKPILRQMLETALKRAKFNSIEKEKEMKKFEARGLYSTEFAEIPVQKKEWTKKFKINPMDANLEDFIKRSEELSKEISKIEGIAANGIGIYSGISKKIFANSEGSLIEQTRAITEPSLYIAAKGKHNETYHEWIAEAKGLEALEGDNSHGKNLEDFVDFIAKGTVELSNAKTAKFEKNVTVVTDPWFNTLLSHEVCGHPLEADRALKRETNWAGRAWWFNNIKDNQIGNSIGSEEITIVSDPTIEGYGNYLFDDEGVEAKKTINIENGILKEFMNSRETAHILGETPNGHMRASGANSMPLIRMSNTYFEKGSWKKEELIEETKEGYYIVGQKTPSIGESRQNFNITCWKCYRIENGEIKELYRNAGIEANSHEFFNTLEAADDLKRFNVPNCGKGTPIQVMKLGNGGPHLRGIANLTGKR